MKKTIMIPAILLALLFGLAACGNKPAEPTQTTAAPAQTTAVQGEGRGDLIEDDGGEGRGDYLPESPADVGWWGEYRGNAGILRVSNFDQNAEGVWHFRFELASEDAEDSGVAAVDADAYAVAAYAGYRFTFLPGETADSDTIIVAGGTAFDGEYPRFDPDAMG